MIEHSPKNLANEEKATTRLWCVGWVRLWCLRDSWSGVRIGRSLVCGIGRSLVCGMGRSLVCGIGRSLVCWMGRSLACGIGRPLVCGMCVRWVGHWHVGWGSH